LRIEVYRDTSPDPIQTRIISLEEPCLPDSFNEVPHRAKDGEIIRIDVTNYAVGSIVIDVNKMNMVLHLTFSPLIYRQNNISWIQAG